MYSRSLSACDSILGILTYSHESLISFVSRLEGHRTYAKDQINPGMKRHR